MVFVIHGTRKGFHAISMNIFLEKNGLTKNKYSAIECY